MMMMMHEDRQQRLQFAGGGHFVFVFSKQEKCRQQKGAGQVLSCRVRSDPVRSGQSGRVRSGQVVTGQVRSGQVRYLRALRPTTNLGLKHMACFLSGHPARCQLHG